MAASGAPVDYAEAVRWYHAAAEQGNVRGQRLLGVMYTLGLGVPQDFVAAHVWLSLAASQGDDEAGDIRDALAKQMTAEQVAEAQSMAREIFCRNDGWGATVTTC